MSLLDLPSFDPAWANAISSIESGGRYDALGPVTRNGDRAFGRYQIMGANIGPWTKEALGQALTPQQFLASPKAQDAVFRAKFGQYAQKYGPEGAARAWFAGEGGMNNPNAKDTLGTSVSGYASKFSKALGGSAPMPLLADKADVPPGLLGAPAESGDSNTMLALLGGMGKSNQPTPMKLAPMRGGKSAFPSLDQYVAAFLKSRMV
jgi:hypothetical protein